MRIGLIPAAGIGSRIFPWGGTKELLPAGSEIVRTQAGEVETPRMVINYTLALLVEAGVERAIVVTNPVKIELIRHLLSGRRHGLDIAFVVDETSSMLQSIDLAYPWIQDSTVLLGMPDSIIHPADAGKQLLDFHQKHGAALSLGLFPADHPERFGVVRVDEEGTVVHHQDKPATARDKWIWGLAAWTPEFTDLLHEYVLRPQSPGREPVLGDAFDEALAQALPCKGLQIEGGQYRDLGSYQEYRKAVWDL